jgi:hypothetical protein
MGQTQGDPEVPGNKGASLYYMIPLERWNVERSSVLAVKEESASHLRPPIGPMEQQH